MGLMDQIERAKQRFDARARSAAAAESQSLVGAMQGSPPDRAQLNSDEQIENRHRFIAASAGHSLESNTIFERIIEGNDLQPVNYLERGALAARAVARISIRASPARQVGWGTGFLIAPGVLLTNHHVFPEAEAARHSLAQFNVESGLDDTLKIYQEFVLEPDRLFHADKEMDFAVVAVAPRSRTDGTSLDVYGCLPLLDIPGKATVGEWLTIIQHPGGQPKQVCARENRLISVGKDVVWYSTDTLGGSSGSPVFNNDWYVVALHHSGVPQTKDGRIQTIDGRDFDDATMGEQDIKWIANEGIRASRIVQTLRASQVGSHPLLQQMFTATPATARVGAQGALAGPAVHQTRPHSLASAGAGDPAMNEGKSMVRVTVSVERSELQRALGSAAVESAALRLEAAPRKKREPDIVVPFDKDYSKRPGFDPDFLGRGKHRVNLPTLSPALRAAAAKLVEKPSEYVLKYLNYSVAVHAERRLALYSAANVDFANRYALSRPSDQWRTDPRIDTKHQLGNSYYVNNNFDRGHLTRNEDMEYGGTRISALQSAADTCHWTNCTPQHSEFNQVGRLWQDIEKYILETSVEAGEFRAQVITGPVLDEDDPQYKGLRFPLQYWKVVVAVNGAGKLFATSYLASQKAAIDQFGIEAAPLEPFGPFKNHQVPILEIERLTGLSFTSGNGVPLSEADPLATRKPRSRRRTSVRESAGFENAPSGYVEVNSVDDIVL